MNIIHKITVLLLLYSGICVGAPKENSNQALKLPSVIGSKMVLQRDMPVTVWGWSRPDANITVSFKSQSVNSVADKNGEWTVVLKPMTAAKIGSTMSISVDGKEKKVLEDILVGEVWLCAGQSNMWHPVSRSLTSDDDFAYEPEIRLFRVELDLLAKWENPQKDCKGYWSDTKNKYSISYFSAVGYFFGRKLAKDLDVPVGLIRSAIGDSMAEAWTSNATLRTNPVNKKYLNDWERKIAEFDEPEALAQYKSKLAEWEKNTATEKNKKKPEMPLHPMTERNRPSRLYNGYIAPLTRLALRGVIWYQGEANVRRPLEYSQVFKDLIIDWRQKWNNSELPFIFVQLPNFGAKTNAVDNDGLTRWTGIRQAQTDALILPKTGMAVTIDLGEADNIHPSNKKPVGERLALLAENIVYGMNVPAFSPSFKSCRFEGNKSLVSFQNTDGGLHCKGTALEGFFVAGKDAVFHKATARIISVDTVELESEKVSIPQKVCYGWAGNPDCNLYNKKGLPAAPFIIENVNSK